jgi:hypothetical protein
MSDTPSYFRSSRKAGQEVLVPLSFAASGWNPRTVRGPAVSGLLAREAERLQHERGRQELRPARWTVDLCAPTRMEPLVVTSQVLQESGRLMLVSVEIESEGRTSARATALFLKPTQNVDNGIWQPGHTWELPPVDLDPPAVEPSLYCSDDAGWSAVQADCQDASRKRAWHRPTRLVEGEAISPFQTVASLADLASLATHWGAAGIAHINADITLAIARLPVTLEVGLAAVDRVETDGVAIGTAAMFDRQGTLGTVVVSALANADNIIDLRRRTRMGPL